ncbi:MAG: polysaccharide export protein [Alphaproteobacteria bacterium]|nr:polysaccharide export protein [Alphaproteobacteria bacterium]
MRRLGHCLIATVLLLPAYAGIPVYAAEHETLLQKMARESANKTEVISPDKDSFVPHSDLPEENTPRSAVVPEMNEPSTRPATRPADSRPLAWPPARYMEAPAANEDENDRDFKMLRVPVGEAQPEDGGLKHAVTFTAASAAPSEGDHSGKAPHHDEADKDKTIAMTPASVPVALASDENKDAMAGAGYVLGSGDKLKITVFGEKDLSGEFIVNDSGRISYPLIGEVSVQDLTLVQAKDKIGVLLKDGYLNDPDITIEMAEFRPFYITGEIRAPGSYAYVAGMSVMNAVVVAGGFTFRADQDEVEILRRTPDGTKMLKDIGTDEKVVPGDIILVEERFF